MKTFIKHILVSSLLLAGTLASAQAISWAATPMHSA